MPVYEYDCAACGPFAAPRPMAEYRAPQACPGCGAAAPRVLLTPPGFAAMDPARRVAVATNERSAHAPRQAAHGPGCGCCSASRGAPKAKTFPSARPWMISH
jgi:putative FmdB family regulatory protein